MLPARRTVRPDRLGLRRERLQLRRRLRESSAQASVRASLLALSKELNRACATLGDSPAAVVRRSGGSDV